MKIAVISMTRTRSSYLLDVLAKNYQIPNLYEYYKTINPDTFKTKCIGVSSKEVWDRYRKQTLETTDKLFLENSSFVVKIFPITVLNYFSNQQGYSKDDVLDLIKFYKINEYDRVFLLTRNNITDLVCSHLYAMQTQFLFSKDDLAKIEYFNPSRKKKVSLSNQDLKFFHSRIDQHLFLEHVHLYLEKHKIAYTKLDYDNIKGYAKENFPTIQSDLVESNFNYSKYLSNYKDIEKQIESLLDQRKKLTDWNSLFF